MSATNRGSKRIESDNYATPMKTINRFLNYWYTLNDKSILEPSAGCGNICKAIKDRYPNSHIVANEIRKEENENLLQCADRIYNLDFLKFKDSSLDFDLIIGNPPFSLAQEFLEKCFEIASDKTDIVMLLRLAFLESRKRYNFWQKHPVSKLYVLSERPSFINGKTDATAYAFYIWTKRYNEQGIYVI
jgi:hypothetical protein